VPVEDYLKPQKRFAHLFGKPRRDRAASRRMADRNIRKFGCSTRSEEA
jgi:pyruvate ferredoxin oxidoreductase beta subunit